MRRVDVVLFDKTGTLTKGEPAVVDLVAVPDDGDRLLLLAGAAEADSEHPLAAAVVAAAADRGVVPAATEFRSRPGLGVAARVDGHEVSVGGPSTVESTLVPDVVRQAADRWSRAGSTVVS